MHVRKFREGDEKGIQDYMNRALRSGSLTGLHEFPDRCVPARDSVHHISHCLVVVWEEKARNSAVDEVTPVRHVYEETYFSRAKVCRG
ncbi:MAG: hypothetical protein AOA65_1368 [Candidatus Bathyarchaeota archaeon BA1]|nr:MAG: hypothetical protein AOA65_1368 [Candidatus Bathyarchaeota archaeon BA1]